MGKQRPKIGVMGGAVSMSADDLLRLEARADRLGAAIAETGCALITGETSGIPGRVAVAARQAGALTIGISAGHSYEEHTERYNAPISQSDVVIYTGFGLKGRNVINIRSSDIVIIFSGSIGTLNEFTIAYDEGKIIGVLEGSGGAADLIPGIVRSLAKATKSELVYDSEPRNLVERCLEILSERNSAMRTRPQ